MNHSSSTPKFRIISTKKSQNKQRLVKRKRPSLAKSLALEVNKEIVETSAMLESHTRRCNTRDWQFYLLAGFQCKAMQVLEESSAAMPQ